MHNALQDVVESIAPVRKVEIVQFMTVEHALSFRQACRVIQIARSLLYCRASSKNDEDVIGAINAYIAKNPKHGFGLLVSSFKLEQQSWGKKCYGGFIAN